MRAEIKVINRQPTLLVNGERQVPVLFFSNTEVGKDDICSMQIKMAQEYGVHLFSVCCQLPVWQKRGHRDFSNALDALNITINNDPNAYILLRINLSIYGERAECWDKEFQGDAMRFNVTAPDIDDGTNQNFGRTAVTLSSDNWLAAAIDTLEEFHELVLSNEKYSEHLIGYHLAAGETGEWFHCSLRECGIDLGETNRRVYQKYLQDKYENIDELSIAWEISQETYESFDDIELPSDIPGNDRSQPALRTLFTNRGDKRYIDYCDYSSEIIADRILKLASAARRITKGDKLIVFFYGYYFDLYDARTGHFRLNKVLNSSNIDAFSSPVCYTDRNQGGVGALMSPADTFSLHGKLWLVENDIRTCLVVRDEGLYDWVPVVPSIEGLIEVYRREAGQMLAHGLGSWYMDLFSRGWQYHPMIWQEISKLKAFYEERFDELTPIEPDVAVVVDEYAMSYVAHAEACGMNLLYQMRLMFYRAGIKFGIYTSNDYEAGLVPTAKLVFYLNPYHITMDRAQNILAMIKKNNAAIVLMHGFCHTEKKVAKLLTGMEIGCLKDKMHDLSMETVEGFFPDGKEFVCKSTGDMNRGGNNQQSNPAYFINGNADLKALAYFTQGDLKGKIGAALCKHDGIKSIFIGSMSITTDAIRGISRICGVHIYCESNDAFYCGNNIYTIHSDLTSGKRVIKLPQRMDLIEYYSKVKYKNTNQIIIEMSDGKTATFIKQYNK